MGSALMLPWLGYSVWKSAWDVPCDHIALYKSFWAVQSERDSPTGLEEGNDHVRTAEEAG